MEREGEFSILLTKFLPSTEYVFPRKVQYFYPNTIDYNFNREKNAIWLLIDQISSAHLG